MKSGILVASAFGVAAAITSVAILTPSTGSAPSQRGAAIVTAKKKTAPRPGGTAEVALMADATCDLVLDAVWTTPAAPAAGDAVTLHCRIHNQGSGPAGGFGVAYTIDGHEQLQWASTGGLAPGASVELGLDSSATPWTATSGTHAINALVDDSTRTDDPDRSNNQLATPVTLTIGGSPPPSSGGRSKLSIHTGFQGGGAESWRFISQGQPAVVKILDTVENAHRVKQLSPSTIIVARLYLPDQPLGPMSPEDHATAWWNEHRATILASPDVDYWEGYNEPLNGDNLTDMAWYGRFEAKRTELLALSGRKSCVGNFALGCPTSDDAWRAFFPAIDAARAHGGILGLHEYGDTDMKTMFDLARGEGWLTGRYRKTYRNVLIPSGKSLPLVITETGLGISHGGWRDFTTAHEYVHGDYQLLWYDGLLKQDDYVLGATIFALEIPDAAAWGSLDISGDVVTQLIAELRAGPPPPVPALPDLVVDGLSTTPASPSAGQPVTVHVTIRNQGTGNVVGGQVIGVAIIVDGHEVTWAASTAGLAAGASVTLDSSGPSWTPTTGSHPVVAHVDDAARIQETDAGNNWSRSPLLVNVDVSPLPFSDVAAGTFYTDPACFLHAKGAIGGYADGTFRPSATMTRGQLSKVAVLAFGVPIVTPASGHFSDVPPGSPFFSFVETALAHGFIDGRSDGSFGPNDPATRRDVCRAIVAVRGYDTSSPPATPTFSDVPASDPEFRSIEAAYAHGLVSGYGDGTFRPTGSATRAQIAKIVFLAISFP